MYTVFTELRYKVIISSELKIKYVIFQNNLSIKKQKLFNLQRGKTNIYYGKNTLAFI